MNDFDFDCLEKKRLARNAFSRKGTRNRKGCRLPHENLTKKELEKMNGEVFTINTLEKISWERFKQLPTGLKEEYLRAIMDRFGVGLANISRDLFGCESACLYQHCKRYGVRVNTTKGGKIAKSTLDRWRSWIDSDLDIMPNPSIAPVSEDEDKPHVCTIDYEPDETNSTSDQPVFRAHDYDDMFKDVGMEHEAVKPDDEEEFAIPYPLRDMSLTLKGTPIDILATLRMSFPALLDKDKTYRFSIRVDDYVL